MAGPRSGMGAMQSCLTVFVIGIFFAAIPELFAQTADSKLAALEKLPPQERQQRLLEGAKDEGEAVVYANMDVAAMKPLTDGFSRKYPGVKATSTHFSGAAIITRIDSEARAGKALSDVVLSGQLGVLALIDKKVPARYRSPEREFYRQGFKDKDGFWTAYMTNVMATAYNTRQVKKEEAPRVLEDLLKPRWRVSSRWIASRMSGSERSSNILAKKLACAS